MGDFTHLVSFSLYWKNFFPNLSGEKFFPRRITAGVQFFFSIIRHERYFFQCRIFFSQEFICMLSSSRNQSTRHFFLKSPITPQKSNGRPLKSTKHLVS